MGFSIGEVIDKKAEFSMTRQLWVENLDIMGYLGI